MAYLGKIEREIIMSHKTTTEKENEILSLWNCNKKIPEIIKITGILRTTVLRVLREHGEKSARDLLNEKKAKILDLFEKGLADSEIANETGYTVKHIKEFRWKNTMLREVDGNLKEIPFPNKKTRKDSYSYISKTESLHGMGYDGLAKAIVLQAIVDYKKASDVQKRGGRCIKTEQMLSDVRRFAKSSWCEFLTDVNLENVIGMIK